jgi:cell division septation protein DedD
MMHSKRMMGAVALAAIAAHPLFGTFDGDAAASDQTVKQDRKERKQNQRQAHADERMARAEAKRERRRLRNLTHRPTTPTPGVSDA